MARIVLSAEDRTRIAAAVTAAERGTTGEIRCVIADDREPMRGPLIAAILALAAPALALLVGFRPQGLTDALGLSLNAWTAAHGAAGDQATATSALAAYVIAQAAILVVALLFAVSPIPRWLTPLAWRKAAVDRAAKAQFENLGLTETRERTGVLLYVSLRHRQAEVLADVGIYETAPHQVWDEVITLLTAPLSRGRAADGFVAAVVRIGEILAEHLPPRSDDIDELPDAPIVTR